MNMASSQRVSATPRSARRPTAAQGHRRSEVDPGDTALQDARCAQYIRECWAHSKSKGFESPPRRGTREPHAGAAEIDSRLSAPFPAFRRLREHVSP